MITRIENWLKTLLAEVVADVIRAERFTAAEHTLLSHELHSRLDEVTKGAIASYQKALDLHNRL